MKSPFHSAPFGGEGDVEPFNLFALLKTRTADIHTLVERRVPVFREGFNLQDYTLLVECFYGFWGPVEQRLSQFGTLRDSDLALPSRLKSCLLFEDLHFLGREPADVRICKELPVLDTVEQALGCLYVLEGSTLGSQIIAPHLENKLRLRQGFGASFFNAYGGATGPRWMDFKRFVCGCVQPQQAEDVVAAAQQTFFCLYEWLGTMYDFQN